MLILNGTIRDSSPLTKGISPYFTAGNCTGIGAHRLFSCFIAAERGPVNKGRSKMLKIQWMRRKTHFIFQSAGENGIPFSAL